MYNSILSVIIVRLETSSRYEEGKIAYKIDTGSDNNLMPLSIYKILFPKNKGFILRTYNNTIIFQFGMCKVAINIKI